MGRLRQSRAASWPGRRGKAVPEARKPAYVLHVDFGPEIGTKKSSAQITELYGCRELVGKLVVAVITFPGSRSARCSRVPGHWFPQRARQCRALCPDGAVLGGQAAVI